MSNLIASQDGNIIVLIDGTKIEMEYGADGAEMGLLVTENNMQPSCDGCGSPYVDGKVTTHFHFCPVEKLATKTN